mgnify:CR=1 FL=1
MYMAREVFHCKPGKAKDVVAKFKKLSGVMQEMGFGPSRIYTDVSGENYWTVVMEQEIEKIDDLAEMSRKTMSDPRMAKAMKNYHELVLNGRREIYKVE